MHQLDITPSQLCLRLPMVVRHRITQDSPLATWRSGPSGVGADASSEVVVVVSLPLVLVTWDQVAECFQDLYCTS